MDRCGCDGGLVHSWAVELSTLDGRALDAVDLEFLMFSDARAQAPLLAESENAAVESMLDDWALRPTPVAA